MDTRLPAAPNVGLIVKWNGSAWADETGNTKWNSVIPYTLSDTDIAVIDAHGLNPSVSTLVRGVGTHIGNAVFDASANRLLVANDEARNLVRFEPNVRGHFLNSRVTTIRSAPTLSGPLASPYPLILPAPLMARSMLLPQVRPKSAY
ncbi:MAG: hypothetical protein DMF76_23795 [Acidobacteria bacterium]|nr:MAG: hypothetical protein DMF76_23795 [Acidobacteriota bacterium]